MGNAKEHLRSLGDQPELTEQQHLRPCRQQLQLLGCLAENMKKSSSPLHSFAGDTKSGRRS